jgi:hypothetical protein
MTTNAFTAGATVTVTGGNGSSSAATALGKPAGMTVGGVQVRIASPSGGVVAKVKFGGSTVQAAATDTEVLPGTVEILTIGATDTHVAVFGVAGTPALDFTAGFGD